MTDASDKPLVVGIGEVLWDLLPDGKQLGGAVANVAYHAGVQGAEARIVSRVGDDELGKDMLETLRQAGLDTTTLQHDSEHPTGTVDVHLEAGQPKYTIHAPVAWDFVKYDDVTATLARQCDAVCFGTLAQRYEATRSSIRRFLADTPPQAMRIFDVNLRQNYYNADILRWSLEQADVVKLNHVELPEIVELLDLDIAPNRQAEELLQEFNLRLVAVTRGENGSLLVDPGQTSDHPGSAVEVRDAVGAGDAFTATLIMGLLAGRDLETINASANRVGAYVCTQSGAMPEIPEDVLPH